MELTEIIEKKKQLAIDIASLLTEFENQTGLDVSSIEMIRQSSSAVMGSDGEYKYYRYVVEPRITI